MLDTKSHSSTSTVMYMNTKSHVLSSPVVSDTLSAIQDRHVLTLSSCVWYIECVSAVSTHLPPSLPLPQLLCSDVSTACFDDICELTWSAKGLQPRQGVRFLSAIFLYEGVIHWILIALFKIPIMWKIETRIRCLSF